MQPCLRLLLAADGPPQLLVVHDGRLLDVQGRHQLLPVIVAQAADIKKYFENIWTLPKIFGLHRSSGWRPKSSSEHNIPEYVMSAFMKQNIADLMMAWFLTASPSPESPPWRDEDTGSRTGSCGKYYLTVNTASARKLCHDIIIDNKFSALAHLCLLVHAELHHALLDEEADVEHVLHRVTCSMSTSSLW